MGKVSGVSHLALSFVLAMGVSMGSAGALSASGDNLPPDSVAGVALPHLSLDMDTVTISGISSGAFMAAQMHIAASDLFKGAGLVAGGLYGCAVSTTVGERVTGTITRALDNCMGETQLLEPVDRFVTQARDWADLGWIDPLSNLSGDPVYLFTGRADVTVQTESVVRANQFYEALGADTVFLDSVPASAGQTDGAGHSYVTVDAGNQVCSEQQLPFVNACNYDQSEAILNVLFPNEPLAPKATALSGRLLAFDQTLYGPGSPHDMEMISMWHTGFAYIPAQCEAEGVQCKLHVSLHGCQQSDQNLPTDEKFYNLIGMNEWADTNEIVVLYPQARSLQSQFGVPLLEANPKGCWNWWGYASDRRFTLKDGDQTAAILRMVDAMNAGLAFQFQ